MIVETEFVTVPAVVEGVTVPVTVTVPSVAVATLTLNPATALLTVTTVDVKATFTGFPTAFVIVEAVVDGVTVPETVTVPRVADATFTFTPDELSIVTLLDVSDTLPATVTSVLVKATLTGFPTAFVMTDAVDESEIVPTVMLTKRYPDASTRQAYASSSV